jgi:hypothetical protein
MREIRHANKYRISSCTPSSELSFSVTAVEAALSALPTTAVALGVSVTTLSSERRHTSTRQSSARCYLYTQQVC